MYGSFTEFGVRALFYDVSFWIIVSTIGGNWMCCISLLTKFKLTLLYSAERRVRYHRGYILWGEQQWRHRRQIYQHLFLQLLIAPWWKIPNARGHARSMLCVQVALHCACFSDVLFIRCGHLIACRAKSLIEKAKDSRTTSKTITTCGTICTLWCISSAKTNRTTRRRFALMLHTSADLRGLWTISHEGTILFRLHLQNAASWARMLSDQQGLGSGALTRVWRLSFMLHWHDHVLSVKFIFDSLRTRLLLWRRSSMSSSRDSLNSLNLIKLKHAKLRRRFVFECNIQTTARSSHIHSQAWELEKAKQAATRPTFDRNPTEAGYIVIQDIKSKQVSRSALEPAAK